MLNYMKSELYRIFHGKEIYVFTIAAAGLTIVLNLILFVFDQIESNFPYGTVRFSLNMMTGSLSFLLVAALIIVSLLFSDEYKNGTMKNVFSFGITRNDFFCGKCIVCGVTALISLNVILVVYIGSAFLLLKNKELLPLEQMLKGIGSNLPIAFAALILAVTLFSIFKKEGTAILCWLSIVWFFPTVLYYLGFKIPWLSKIAAWLPWNYLHHEVSVTMSEYQCLWNTPQGLLKCILVGIIGIVIFYTAGIVFFKKRDIA
jgi:ABC-2 type transport system permease protein